MSNRNEFIRDRPIGEQRDTNVRKSGATYGQRVRYRKCWSRERFFHCSVSYSAKVPFVFEAWQAKQETFMFWYVARTNRSS